MEGLINCEWLPGLMLYEDYDNSWKKYEQALYESFCEDFIESKPQFQGKNVAIRRYPIEYGKEEAFYHITCQDYYKNDNRVPDFRRCERIKWVRKFIENYACNREECKECSGIKTWEEIHKNRTRIHILFEEERFIVVIEKRDIYYLLVTAYYFDHKHTLNKKLKKYKEYQKTQAKDASQ